MIDVRLKEERERLGLSQPLFAQAAGAAKRTLADWEKGVSSPTAVQLSALAKVGVDVLYVLTGQTSQSELVARPINDRARLASAIEAVEAGLADTKRHLPPKKKAELVLAAYDLMAQPEQTRDNVIKLLRLAA